MVERLGQPEAGSSPLAFATEYAQPLWRQYLIILTKNVVCYWRCAVARLRQCTNNCCQRLSTRPACSCVYELLLGTHACASGR